MSLTTMREFDRKVVNILNGCMPLILSGLAELRAQGAWTLRAAWGRLEARLGSAFNPVDT